jgi:hypothetical protein
LIAINSLSFPNAIPHASVILRLCRQERIEDALSYMEEHDCLKNSITTIEKLRLEA